MKSMANTMKPHSNTTSPVESRFPEHLSPSQMRRHRDLLRRAASSQTGDEWKNLGIFHYEVYGYIHIYICIYIYDYMITIIFICICIYMDIIWYHSLYMWIFNYEVYGYLTIWRIIWSCMDVTITIVIIIVIVIVIIYGYLIYSTIYIYGYLTVNLELKLIRCLIFGGGIT
jgi:hypothetical protein